MAEKKSKGQVTQEKIVGKALDLFGQHGFAQTSMQMIADSCRLSQGAVMQHFPSKERLMEAVRKFVSQSNHEFVDGKISYMDNGVDSLKRHLRGNIEWSFKNRAAAQIILLTYVSAHYDKNAQKAAQGAMHLGTDRILRFLHAAEREKLIPPKADLKIIADLIHSYLIGIITKTLAASDNAKWTGVLENQVNEFLRALLKTK